MNNIVAPIWKKGLDLYMVLFVYSLILNWRI